MGNTQNSRQFKWNIATLDWVVDTGATGGGGDASAANQVTGNASLTSIDGKLPVLSAGRIPVVLPAGSAGLTNTELRATAVPVTNVNGIGAAAVNIQDGGNSITVDGSVGTNIPTDTHNSTLNAPYVGVPVGGGNASNDQFFMLPIMAHNWDRPTINNQAVSVVMRNGLETDGTAAVLGDLISVGGARNVAPFVASKLQFSADALSTGDPTNTYGVVTREYGQSFIASGTMDLVGTRAAVSNRKVVKTATLWHFTSNAFIGTIKPVVSFDFGTTWAYVSAINVLTGVSATEYTDGAVAGAFVTPFGNGATDFGFEVTARTSGNITWRASGNSQGTNAVFASVVGNVGVNNFPASQAVTGPLTDAQIRATALPVSGSFFQATQPVSAASLPLPTGAATETTLASLNSKVTAVNTGATVISAALPAGTNNIGDVDIVTLPALPAGAALIGKVGIDQTTPGTTNAVVVTANSLVSTANSTAVNLAANATFTGTAEDVSEYSTIAVSVFSSHASAVDGFSAQQSSNGTDWDNADPYSIPAATGKVFQFGVGAKFFRLVYTNGATLTTALRIQTTFSKSAKRGSSIRPQDSRTNDNDFEEVATYLNCFNGTSWDRARGTIANGLAVDVTRGPAITKGTQGTTGFTTQDLKDAGRVMVTYTATALAGATAEALITLTPYRDLVAGTAGTTHAVTAGKRLRLQSLTLSLRSTSTVNVGALVRFRMLAGAVLVGSPVHNSIACMSSNLATAVIGNAQSVQIDFPDGFELSGTMQFGLTQLASAITATLDIHVTGYEY